MSIKSINTIRITSVLANLSINLAHISSLQGLIHFFDVFNDKNDELNKSPAIKDLLSSLFVDGRDIRYDNITTYYLVVGIIKNKFISSLEKINIIDKYIDLSKCNTNTSENHISILSFVILTREIPNRYVLFEYFINKGVSIEHHNPVARHTTSPLISSVSVNNKYLVKLLQLGANPDFIDSRGESALSQAIRAGKKQMAGQLLSYGADLNWTDSNNNLNLLSLIIGKNYYTPDNQKIDKKINLKNPQLYNKYMWIKWLLKNHFPINNNKLGKKADYFKQVIDSGISITNQHDKIEFLKLLSEYGYNWERENTNNELIILASKFGYDKLISWIEHQSISNNIKQKNTLDDIKIVRI